MHENEERQTIEARRVLSEESKAAIALCRLEAARLREQADALDLCADHIARHNACAQRR